MERRLKVEAEHEAQLFGQGRLYRADDIERAASGIPKNAFSILLSHTPEVYEQAAAAEFDLMLSGHTHGGQLCLPGGIPIKLEAVLPRSMGAGLWRHRYSRTISLQFWLVSH